MNEWNDRWVDGQMDGWVGGWVDGWIDGSVVGGVIVRWMERDIDWPSGSTLMIIVLYGDP